MERRQSADAFWLRMAALLDVAERPEFALPMLLVGVAGTALIWYVVVTQPRLFASLYHRSFYKGVDDDESDAIRVYLMLVGMAAAIGFPYLVVFTLAHLLFPVQEDDQPTDPGVPLSSFGRPDKSVRQWRICMAAGTVGALNLVALVIFSF